MSELVTDDRLRRLIADAMVLLADRESPELRAMIDALCELQQHRARIAAHAAAHPERLSERAVNVAIANSEAVGDSGLGRDEVYAALLEIQQRRASDLTEIDRLVLAGRLAFATSEERRVIGKILNANGTGV